MSGTTSDNEWQWVRTSGTTSDSEWLRVTTYDNEWQRVTTSDTTSDNKWQWVTASDSSSTTNENYNLKNGWLPSFQWQNQIHYYFKGWMAAIRFVK